MKELDIKRMFAYQLLKKDSTDVIFFEYPFHFGRRRADIICVEDGMIVGYEIKSAFDRIDRLEDQLESYTQLFDFVYVICDSKHISAVRKITPARIGIYECTLRGVKRIRKASQIKNFDSITTLDAIPMDSLRKQFKTSGKSKLEICHKISNTQKRSDIKNSFRKYIIHKYSDQTSHFKSEFSDVITLDDVYALSLAPNKLGA
ncbi:hypothetical protein C4K06_5113 [Pseudomonas chlororaphis subsp. aureofaciens]|uniref:sce7726 family protein n=1 Tax=Pseudomonas chlororaphis TaxID=587753 RepID=UPI000F5766A8|nr:sce7726 family protein [Pseudomonas chlororaphis]AZE38122.1 hypothetical protein C4K06_5113 [Pseudomonas chlororaphis subsp. aureofaciens]